jgi:signal transduction histidine kinase
MLPARTMSDELETLRAEVRRLRQSEERFRRALDHSPVTAFEIGLDLSSRWLHNVPDAVDADEVRRTIDGDRRDPFLALAARVIESGQGTIEEVITMAAGEPRQYLVSIEPLREAGGAIAGASGSAIDITKLKRTQEQLAQALGFREQMIGVLGHDLRNPLAAVRGLAGLLLLGDEVSPGGKGHLRMIDQAGRRMDEIIGTLLDFTESRFRGRLPVTPAPADLAVIVNSIVGELRAAYPERVIDVAVRGDTQGRWDAARMAQVVSNLVGNAITHGAAGESVRVSIEADAEVTLTVANRGAPIAPELLGTLFEPFRRGEDDGTRGLGLGLYIVDQIVRAHGGTIGVESTAVHGTRFTVRLPRG